MATLPEAIAAGTVTQDANPANSLYTYWTDGVSDNYVTIADLLKNPGAIGSGTPSSGAFTTLSSTGVASLDSLALTTDLAVAHGGTGASTAAGARSNLGLVIGTNVQAYDAGLQSIAGLTTAADRMIYTTASDTYAVATLTAFARSILDDADAATVRATLDVDQAGTDNSTDVTLAGAYNYLTIAGQEITLNQIDLTTDVTGNLPAANAAFTDQNVLTTSSPTFANVGLSTGGALRAGTSATNTLLLQAYDVDGAAYTTFLTLTSGNTPTADLAASVTIDGNAILDSTWAGSSNITTLGTIGAGTWQGTAIANAYVADLPTSKITSGTFADARIAESNVTQHVAAIDHDSLLNFAANEHIDWTSTSSNFSTTGTLASGNATVTGTLGVTDNVTVTRSSPNLYLQDTGTNFATIRFYTSTSTERVTLRGNAAGSFIVETGGPSPVTALTLDSSQNATFAGDLTLSAGDLEVTTGLGRFGGSTDPASMTTGVVLYNGTAPSAGAANAIALYSKDLSAGNTMLGIYTEGSPVGTGTPTQDRTVAVEVNGTTLYLLASTAAS